MSWLDFLVPATWNGVPFSVLSSEVSAGRKTAVHDYPFRDTVYVEDLGRKGRRLSFRGFLVGDDCYVLEQAMHAAASLPGTGLLTHPTFGIVLASLVDFSSAQEAERGRVVSLNFSFIESAPSLLPGIIVATVEAVLTLATSTDSAVGGDFTKDATPASVPVTVPAECVVPVAQAFTAQVASLASDAGLLANAVAGLPPPAGSTYGRYATGALSNPAPGVTTVQQAIANATTAQGLVQQAGGAMVSSATAGAGLAATVQALTEALRTAAIDPADQVRLLTSLAPFAPMTMASQAPLGAAIQAAQLSIAALCRRAVLTSLARACAAFAPASYNDAIALRQSVVTLFDLEIQIAADGDDVATYQALRALRTAIVTDLNTRAATLPTLITVTTQVSVPALTLAYKLYADAARADDIIARAMPIHPAFLPTSMVLLSA